jgi:hypothetical protein
MGGWTPGLGATELREKAWEKLVELQPQPEVALLQEATAPPARLGLDSQVGGLTSESPVGSLIWSPHLALIEPQRLGGIGEQGYVATARIAVGDREVALISFHARTQGPGVVANIEALFDRLGEWIGQGSFILAGDFNSCRLAEQVWPGWRHLEFFEQVEAGYGMFNCYWQKQFCYHGVTTAKRARVLENAETPALAGISGMELAGLEPATSWVRSRRSPN